MSFRTTTAFASAAALATAGLLAPAAVAAPEGDQVIINEVYSNGTGLSGPYLNDYIELYNPSDATIVLDGMSVTVIGGINGNHYGTVELAGSLAAGDHYLLKLQNSAAFPSDDAVEVENFDVEDAELRVPSQNASVLLTFGESTLDLVGYGVTERYEGTAARAAQYDESLSRTDGIDTDDNAADFTSQEPSPQHSVIEVPEDAGEVDLDDLREMSSELSSLSSR